VRVCVCVQHFRDAIDACLQQAVKQGIKSIAFPVLGTGVLNYPDDFVASCMTTMIESFCQGQPGRCTDIRIVRYRDTEGIVSPCLNTHIIILCLNYCS
jgi:O-acetyl-ADP-ribose deacetylase (regulator of RNase III)